MYKENNLLTHKQNTIYEHMVIYILHNTCI